MDEYIDKKAAINSIANNYCMDCENSNGILCRACEHQDDMDIIDSIPKADVQPITITENMAVISDEFICKNCGIHLKDYIKVVLDEQYYDYEPKFCPECGAKIECRIKALKRNEPLYTMTEICKMNGVEFNPRDVIDGEKVADVQPNE